MEKKTLRPPVKTHGGKYYLRNFIIENFPDDYQNYTYCEPMCAGASVFLNKLKSSKLEVINDIDKGIISVFKALRDEPLEFIDRIQKIKYTEKSFKMALSRVNGTFEDYVDHAINEYMLRRMSRGGMKKAFAWSERQRGGKPGDVNAWETMIEELPAIADRVKDTIVLSKHFMEVIKAWDEDDTLFYIDPPYLHSTRTESATNVYEHEMSVEDHMDLLHVVKNCRSKIMISGYSSPLYNRSLKGWKCKKKSIANHSSQSKIKERRLELLWMNY